MARSGQNTSDPSFKDRRSNHPKFEDITVGDYAGGVPNIRIGAMFKSLLAQFLWLIPLGFIGMGVAFYLTKDIKRTYNGEGRLMVQLGKDYVYDSVTGPSQAGVMMTPDTITLNEIAIMKNTEVVKQVIGEMVGQFGEARFAKAQYENINKARRSGDSIALKNALVDLNKSVAESFEVSPQPKSSIVNISYTHEDGDVAVATLNAFIHAYLSYRRTIFVEGSVDVITERRKATEEQLDKNEREIQQFLSRNGISNFDSEQGGATGRTEGLRADLNELRGNLAESEAALAAVESMLRETPEQINLYVDDRALQRVTQAELELKNLLARYLPGSDPVMAKQAEIQQYKALQASNAGEAFGGRRVGPNTTYQALLTRRNVLKSTSDAYREKEFALERQFEIADEKVRKLTKIMPSYQALLRERSTLERRHRGYTTKEQEALIDQQTAEAQSENIRVISYASLPQKGRNMRMIMALLITLAWGFTLFMLALLKVFLDPKLYSKPSYGFGRRGSDAAGERRGSRSPAPSAAPGQTPAPIPAQPVIPEPVSAPVPQPYREVAAAEPKPHAPREAYPIPQTSQPTAQLAQPYQAQAYEGQVYESAGGAAYDIYNTPHEGQNSLPILGIVPSNEQA